MSKDGDPIIEYRLARPDDAGAIARLHARSWRESYRGAYSDAFLDGDLPAERLAVWRERLEKPARNQLVQVALDGPALVGFICAYGADDPRWGSLIDNLHVASEAKGRGIGAALMRRAAAWLAEAFPGVGVYLWVLEMNAPARRFYERIGARNEGVTVMETHGGAVVRSCRYTWARPELLSRARDVKTRALTRREVADVWTIDRSERVERVYSCENGELVLRPELHDVSGWPPGEAEAYGPVLLDCFDRGGTFFGAFDGATLVGVAVLECRFIGRASDRLQLVFLHVSRAYRGSGLGRALFEQAAAKARALGARRLYVSATPSENTVRFYLRRGCRLAQEVDAELFEREPEDIHLDLEIPG